MKPKDVRDFESAVKCHICGHELLYESVKDNCHLTGKYQGDVHLFVTKVRDDLRGIPHTEEKYISFSSKLRVSDKWNGTFEIRLLDGFKFVSSSLDALAKGIRDFKNLKEYFDNSELPSRKRVYPYEWVNLEQMNSTKFPPNNCFYSKFTDSGISETDYAHAKRYGKRLSPVALESIMIFTT